MSAVTWGSPRQCPDLASLEKELLDPAVAAHVTGCQFCELVCDVLRQVKAADDDCLKYDALLAARDDRTLNAAGRNLLARHLASCEDCRAVAETEDPADEGPSPDIPPGLPSIDGDAYALGIEVGRGGMGRVIDAQDRRVGRSVVIKELLGDSPSHAARFEREARLTARLQHPGIVPIYEIGKWSSDGTPFYAMRKIEGRTFDEAIAKASTLPARVVLLPSLIAACETIAFAHSKCVIHRDLKPTNIMLGDYGETIVIDWGLAKDLSDATDGISMSEDTPDAGASDRLTGVGQAIGTPAYMPPEQTYGTDVDTRSDVYAIGAMLYQLLAGVPPYRGDSGNSILRAVRKGPPEPIEEVALGAPRELVSIVTKAMARKPEDRYPTAKELADELERFQKGLLVEAHTYSRGELVKRFVKRNRAALTVTGLAAIVLAVVATISIGRVLRSREEARATARELLLEKGRIEQLAGNHLRALAYLHEAQQQGGSGPALDLLIGRAVTDIGSGQPLDCGGDDRSLEVSRDGNFLAAACHDRARVWRLKNPLGAPLSTPTPVATLEVPHSRAGFDNLTFSPDGSLIATWGEDGIARLWQLAAMTANPKPPVFRQFPHHQPGAKPALITFTTFTADTARIATTGDDGFAQIWNIASGREERSIEGVFDPGHADASEAVRRLFGKLTPDGKLVTLTFSGAGAKFDAITGNHEGTFQHGGTVAGGENSPDGKLAVSCGIDGTSKLVDLATGELLHVLEGHTDVVWRCLFDARSSRVLTSSHDGTAKVWALERDRAGKPQARLATTVVHGDLIWIGRFSPDGSRIVTISPGKNMKVWDSASGALLATYVTRGKDAQFLPDNRLAALRGDGKIQIWARDTSRLSAFTSRGDSSILGTTLDGECVATLVSAEQWAESGVKLWRADTGQPIDHPHLAVPVAFSDTRVAATFVTPDPVDPTKSAAGLLILDGMTGKQIARLVDRSLHDPATLRFSGNGERIAATWSTRAEVWDVARGVRLASITGANRIVLSTSGTRAVAWSESDPSSLDFHPPTQPVVWDVDANKPLITLPAIDARPIAFALEDRRLLVQEATRSTLAAPGWPRTPSVSIWNVDHGIRVMWKDKIEIAPTIDPTGQRITTISTDRDVSIWSAFDGRLLSAFNGEPFQSAQVDGHGNLLVAIGDYGRAAMILSADGRVLARHELEHDIARVTPNSFKAPSSTAWWTPDSTRIATQSRTFATWSAANRHSKELVTKMARTQVPWRIDNGRLELIRNGRITGEVSHKGEVVEGAVVEVLMRRPADMSDKPVNWETMQAQLAKLPAVLTDARGRFSIENLVLGQYEYLVTVTSRSSPPKSVEALAGPVDDEPLSIVLD